MNVNNPGSKDLAKITLAVLFIGLLIAASLWILRPFFTSIVWATMIAIATWPVLLWLRKRLRHSRGLAAAVMTVLVLLVVMVPFLVVMVIIIEKADEIAYGVKALGGIKLPPMPEWAGRIPLAGQRIVSAWQHLAALSQDELAAQVAPFVHKATRFFVAEAGSLALMVVEFFLTIIITAILYVQGDTAAAGVRKFARRLAGQNGEDAVILAAKAVRGVALGIVVTAIIQSTVGGIGLAVSGVPAVASLTAVMFVLCLAQLGPGVVMIPAAVWMYWTHGVLWGTILLVFAVIAIGVDNFIKPVLIRKGVELSLVLITAGVIGGLISFGIIGLFIGPVVLAVAFTLLKAWVSHNDGGEELADSDQ